ncbi:PAS domain-containing protein [Arthrobacter sp. Sa2BUA2]|uniref:histidine kinase n=1 Tax=Arthrobacter pullicola TaxID=2762224 RepID=A0ABR8YL58_9MICC|nr:ATP-binding protein [Arthrobacter pullicola]MBD8044916.1 PAS domain-containing protein [Arthrobacter pullicola]
MGKWSLASRLLMGQLAFIACLSAGLSWVLYHQAEQRSYAETAARMLAISETVAADPFVLSAASSPDPSSSLQPFARAVMDAAGIDFLTIMAPDGTRFTHRSEEQIGRVYLGSVDQALRGEPFTEVYTGTLGPSVRAITPVLGPDGTVTALVSAGITVDRVGIARDAQLPAAFLISLAALACGSLAAYGLSRYLRHTTRDRKPEELRDMFTFYDSALHSLREGLLLLDNDGRLVLWNEQAAALLGLELSTGTEPEDPRELGLPAALADLLHTGRSAQDEFHFTRDRILVVNQSPAVRPPGSSRVPGRRWIGRTLPAGAPAAGAPRRMGTVTTLRDHTEVEALTGELQSMRTLTDALQSQAHEHANRLHTVVSLIELDRPREALEFATRDLAHSQQLADDVAASVGDPALAALLAGKKAQARERGIRVAVELIDDAAAETGPAVLDSGELVTVLGNLLDNAFDAVQGLPSPWVAVQLAVVGEGDGRGLQISVQDSGPGVPRAAREEIFEQGFSTKDTGQPFSAGAGRGFGLPLVRQAVLRLGGTLALDSAEGGGARFTVRIPLAEAVRQ